MIKNLPSTEDSELLSVSNPSSTESEATSGNRREDAERKTKKPEPMIVERGLFTPFHWISTVLKLRQEYEVELCLYFHGNAILPCICHGLALPAHSTQVLSRANEDQLSRPI